MRLRFFLFINKPIDQPKLGSEQHDHLLGATCIVAFFDRFGLNDF